jgi:hypothetical protein
MDSISIESFVKTSEDDQELEYEMHQTKSILLIKQNPTRGSFKLSIFTCNMSTSLEKY